MFDKTFIYDVLTQLGLLQVVATAYVDVHYNVFYFLPLFSQKLKVENRFRIQVVLQKHGIDKRLRSYEHNSTYVGRCPFKRQNSSHIWTKLPATISDDK